MENLVNFFRESLSLRRILCWKAQLLNHVGHHSCMARRCAFARVRHHLFRDSVQPSLAQRKKSWFWGADLAIALHIVQTVAPAIAMALVRGGATVLVNTLAVELSKIEVGDNDSIRL